MITKNLILFLIITGVLFSCGKNQVRESSGEMDKNNDDNNQRVSNAEKPGGSENKPDTNKNIYGYYTGEFNAVEYDKSKDVTYANKISISIDSIKGEKVFGHSVVAGNNRPFTGVMVNNNGNINIEALEPGDDQYDGKFNFIIKDKGTKLSGKWDAFKKDIYVTKREYDLNKKEFRYDKNVNLPESLNWNSLYENDPKFPDKMESLTADVTKINSSNTLLSKKDIENMYKGDLEILRNSIYARHGYSFKTRKIRYIFDSVVDWYMPVSTDVRNELTDLEKKNIDLIKRYEEHAEKYYDEYGR